jgi:hypothetical protein
VQPGSTSTNGGTTGDSSSTGSTGGTTGSTGGTTGSTGGTTGSTAGTTGSTGGTTGSTAGTTGTTGGTTAGTTAGTTGSTGGTTGSTGGTTGSGPLDVGPGTYDVTTKFDLVDALPPDVEEAVRMALSFTNSPGGFILDMAGKIPVIGYIVDAINLFGGIRDKITMGIDEYINRWSGGMVTTMHDLSVDVEAALKGLKSTHRLVLSKPDAAGNLAVQDTLRQLVFTYKGVDYFYPQNANAMASATYTGLQLKVAAHTYDKGVRFGGMLVDLIDNVALPQLTGVNSLGELLNQLVNCGGVGTAVWGYIYDFCIGDHCIYEYIDQDDITKLCQNALDAVGRMIEKKISELDAPGMMSISEGNCLAVENRGKTGHADSLINGTWALTAPIGVGNMTLPGTFEGILGPDVTGPTK